MKYFAKFRPLALGAVASMLLGCAPVDPVPPLFGPGSEGILLFILVAVVGYLVWHALKNKSTKNPLDDNSGPSEVNARLEALEKEMQIIKTKIKGEHHE